MRILSIGYSGSNSDVPSEFYTRYLGVGKEDMRLNRFIDYTFSVKIEIAFKKISLIKWNAWKYYEWVDIFYDRINRFMSNKFFFEKIGWAQIETMLHCIDNFGSLTRETCQ